MKLLAIITDWHDDPLYSSAIKNILKTKCKEADTVIFDNLPQHNLLSASFVANEIINGLPKNSVIVLGFNSSADNIKSFYLFETEKYFILAPDNGVISLIDIEVKNSYIIGTQQSSFAEKDILIPAACELIKNHLDISSLPTDNQYKKLTPVRVIISENMIKGNVLYIDSYGNAITNITKEIFDKYSKGRNYVVSVKYRANKIFRIRNNYIAEPGEFIALFNSFGYLEISQVKGDISSLLKIDNRSQVIIEFSDPEFD